MFAGQKHLDNLCVMVDRNNGQLDIANRMVFPMPELERGVRVVRLAGAQRRRDAVRRRLRRARAVPLRPAQRQADGDHLPRHERARRALGFPEQAQGHGAGRADRAGTGAADGAARATASRSSARSTRPARSAGRRARCRTRCSTAPRRCISMPAATASASCRCRRRSGPCRRDARRRATSGSATTPRCCRRIDPAEGVRRQRHRHRRDEGVRARSARGLDRLRPGDDQRARSRRGRGRSAARAERRRRRSQHDGASARRSPRSAINAGSARSARSSTGRCCGAIAVGHQERLEAIGAPRRLAERGPRPRPDDAGHRRRTSRRAPTAPRTWATTTAPIFDGIGAPEDHRRLLPAADARR